MAQAFVDIVLNDISPNTGSTADLPVNVAYIGSDIMTLYGRSVTLARLSVTIDPANQTAAQVQAAIAAAIRSYASSNLGISVPTGAVLFPAYVKV
jgi:hypothetical protein